MSLRLYDALDESYKKKNDATFRFVASPLVVPGSIIIPTAKDGLQPSAHHFQDRACNQ